MTIRADLATEQLAVGIRRAAELLDLSPRSIERLVAEDRIPSIKLGARRLIPIEALHQWLAEAAGGTA